MFFCFFGSLSYYIVNEPICSIGLQTTYGFLLSHICDRSPGYRGIWAYVEQVLFHTPNGHVTQFFVHNRDRRLRNTRVQSADNISLNYRYYYGGIGRVIIVWFWKLKAFNKIHIVHNRVLR